jgi:hypothetical protein
VPALSRLRENLYDASGQSPAKVMIDDLASVDLDIAAMQQGYKRPDGAGYALDVIVVGKAVPKPSFFAWSWS